MECPPVLHQVDRDLQQPRNLKKKEARGELRYINILVSNNPTKNDPYGAASWAHFVQVTTGGTRAKRNTEEGPQNWSHGPTET